MPDIQPNDEAQRTAHAYADRIARSSGLPYAAAEDARAELTAHVLDVASELARTHARSVTAAEVEAAIGSLGSDATVAAAFFPANGVPTDRAAYQRAALAFLAIGTAFASLVVLMMNFDGVDVVGAAVVLAVFGVSAFGAASIWMLSARWQILTGILTLSAPLLTYAAVTKADDPHEALLYWVLPAALLFIAAAIRSQMAPSARPWGRVADALEPRWRRASLTWRQWVPLVLGSAALCASVGLFPLLEDPQIWWAFPAVFLSAALSLLLLWHRKSTAAMAVGALVLCACSAAYEANGDPELLTGAVAGMIVLVAGLARRLSGARSSANPSPTLSP